MTKRTHEPVKFLFADNDANPPSGLTLEEQHTWRARMCGGACGYIDEATWLDIRARADEGTERDRDIRAKVAEEIARAKEGGLQCA